MSLSRILIIISLAVATYGQAYLPGDTPGAIELSQEALETDFSAHIKYPFCSGSIVRFEDSLDTDQGMMLTNGHCIGRIRPGTAKVGGMFFGKLEVRNTAGIRIGTVVQQNLIYATMTNTDLALVALNESYQEIFDRLKVEPLTLSSQRAVIGTRVEIVAGFLKRSYICDIEAIVFKSTEEGFEFKDSLRLTGPECNTRGGTSGAPVLLEGTRTIIAVNNSGTTDEGNCGESGVVCELDEEGNVTSQLGYKYAQQISDLYTCRDDNRQIDLSVEGCMLIK